LIIIILYDWYGWLVCSVYRPWLLLSYYWYRFMVYKDQCESGDC